MESKLSTALIKWYDFKPNTSILFVFGYLVCNSLADMLVEDGHSVDCVQISGVKDLATTVNAKEYDYIIGVGIIEKADYPVGLLTDLMRLLKVTGVMLIGTENRLGLKYFCGDRDTFTNKIFDGITGYSYANENFKKAVGGRLYSKAEINSFFEEAGFYQKNVYSVLPTLTRPQMLLAEGYKTNELLKNRIFPEYNYPDTVFLEEGDLYQSLMDNGMLHQMANGYLFEITVGGAMSKYDQITVQGDRAKDEALATMITAGVAVKKKALYSEAILKLENVVNVNNALSNNGVPVVQMKLIDNSITMPYVKGQILTEYFIELLQKDENAFEQTLDEFYNHILASSDHIPYEDVNWREFDPGWKKRKVDDPNIDKWKKLAFGSAEERKQIGPILKRGYVDMVSLNCFKTEGGFVFFDQEFYVENFPAYAILVRTIDLIYNTKPELSNWCPRERWFDKYCITPNIDTWRLFTSTFMRELRLEDELEVYHRKHRCNSKTFVQNRLRMNYSEEEYERLFLNIFGEIENKKIYLFGSGRFAKRFVEEFKEYYDIAGMIDNDSSRWGTEVDGIPVIAPNELKNISTQFKVYICIKYYDGIIEQLKDLGVKDIAIYNPSIDYVRPLKKQFEITATDTLSKPYHIGYVAGVFDLFHVGHVNLFRRAKEQCDYLIVGVVSDRQVVTAKKTSPHMDENDRLEIVESCKYVDEAFILPYGKSDTEDVWRMYHFDVQFSGSDYENDAVWLAKKAFLNQHGADLVFFPYTEKVSSTKLKAEIVKDSQS